jgi:uncharacterized repeat protein (TIGR01451 family)
LNFQLSDPLVDSSSNNIRCSPVSKGSTLTVAARTTVCTGSYTTTQANIDAGQTILNVATASFNNAPSLSAQAPTSVTQKPLLSITKAANRPSVSAVGDVISYSIVVKNDGNVNLANLQVRDDRVDAFANDLRCSPTAEGAVLVVGASTTCTGTYVATQRDINVGAPIVNTAFAQAGNAAQVSATASVNVVQRPAFSIVKRANRETVRAAGDVITWTVEVLNTGTVDLTGFRLTDALIDGVSNDLICTPVARGGTLGVAVKTTCVGTTTATQADINTQTSIVNTASAQFAEAPPASASATVSVVAAPALTITKSASPTVVSAASQVIT